MKDDNNGVVEVANVSGNITGDLTLTSTDEWCNCWDLQLF